MQSTRRGSFSVHRSEKTPGSKYSSTSGLSPRGHLERQAEFHASTRESPREAFFNTSRGQIPLPWLGSNAALPLATRMETRLPWRPTRGSLTSPSYLVRNRTLGPPLENHPETPPSSRR